MISDMIKQAVIDAKAARQMAVANAKQTLAEAFTPKLQAMFANKLKEEVESLDESEATKVGTGPAKAVSQGNPKKVSDTVKLPVGVGDPSGPSQTKPMADDKIEEEVSPEMDDSTKITDEDLDEVIRELEAEVAAGNPPENPEETELPPVDATQAPVDAIPHAEPDGDECPVPTPAPVAQPTPGQPPVGIPSQPPVAQPPVGGNPEEEEIDLDELVQSITEEKDEECKEDEKKEKKEDEEELDETKKETGIPTPEGGNDPKMKNVTGKDPTTKGWSGDNKGPSPTGKQTKSLKESTEVTSLREQIENLKKELDEHKKVITIQSQQINEVNLLNCKLLYTNKLFKEFTLNNNQKMKVVESFDLTKNVREVKLAYALMSESLNNFGGKTSNKTANSTVATITEGMASKVVASTKPAQNIISESVNVMAERFQKLAGIKKLTK